MIQIPEMKLSEAQIEQQILVWLFYKKIWAWKNITGGYFDAKSMRFKRQRSHFAINGVPDIVGVFRGRPMFIEVKGSKGKMTVDQLAFKERALKENAICFVARSVTDVEGELSKYA